MINRCITVARSPGCLLGAALVATALLPAAEPARVNAVFADVPPKIDGRLDDVAWARAEVITGFTQVLPREGAPPSERTEVRILFDHDGIYLGIRCFDTEPQRILATRMQHDADFAPDDVVTIALDTFGRQRDGYTFAVNPAGARADGLFGKFSGENPQWDTVWTAKTSVDELGWTAEIALPCTSLSFDPRAVAWGLNIERIIRRRQETVRWCGLSRAKSVVALEDFGELRGLRDLRQGRGWKVKPYLRSTYRIGPLSDRPESTFNGGLDVSYHITPTLTALGTVRPDFAEADVDDRVVKLSRFPTFFPEKRDFFLQDAPLFSFGGLPASASPYFSRRIGLGADGRPVDVRGGLRLTGRAGGTSLALLDVWQAAHHGIAAKNLAVARVSRQVLAESGAGLIFTSGDPRTNGTSWLAGADFNYQNSRLADGRLLTANGYVMRSDSGGTDGVDWAFGGDVDFPNEPLDVHLTLRQWGRQFGPALGFVPRVGVREYILSAEYIWRPNTDRLRSFTLELRPFFTTDLHSQILEEDHDLPGLTFETPANDRLVLEYTFSRDVLDEPYAIRPGLVLPARRYAWGQFKPSFQSSPARPVSVSLGYRGGSYYDGTQHSGEAGLDWRPSRFVTLGAAYELHRIRLREGAFTVRLASWRATIAFNPDLIWGTVVQYDNLSAVIGLNSRVRWTYRPGSDLFFVVNQGWDYDDDRFRPQLTELTLKVGATFRF